MCRHLMVRSLPCLAVLLMVSCKGCFADTSTHATTDRVDGPVRAKSILSADGGGDELQILDTSLVLSAGETDFKNRYLSTIMVMKEHPWEGEVCSGVLLSPRLALTAGHCVCERRREGQSDAGADTVIDSSACVKTVYVSTVTYDPATARVGTGGETRIHEGVVLPHPEFRLQLDYRQQVVSSKADLALIRLREPVGERVTIIPLAAVAVQAGEPLVMAGYGYGSAAGAIHGLRFFRRNRVARLGTPTDERVLYEQQGAYLYNGFNGGPCFREEGQGRWLVGIASLGSEKELAMTDTYTYRDWLRASIEDAP